MNQKSRVRYSLLTTHYSPLVVVALIALIWAGLSLAQTPGGTMNDERGTMSENDFGAPEILTPADLTPYSGQTGTDALSWQLKANTPEAISRTAGVFDSIGNFHLVCGNCNSHISHPYDEIWQPGSNSWSRGLTHPSGRYGVHNHDVARIGNVIYVGGGSQGSGGYYNSLTAIDLDANDWSVRAAMPQNSFLYYDFCAAGGNVYCFGGYNQVSVLSTNYRYNPSSNTWTLRARMPQARRCAMVAVIGDTIHVFGGFSRNDLTSSTTTHWKYNWVTNVWTQGTAMPTDLAWGRAVVVTTPDSGAMIYLAGGVNGGNATTRVYRYSQRYDAWANGGSMPVATRSHAAGANDQRVVVVGGYAHGLLSATQDAELPVGSADVQAVSITAPVDTQPSGTVIAPQATVRNNSTTAQTFDVRFTISDGYTDTHNVTVPPNSQVMVTFSDWTAGPSGTWVTKCSTMLAGDAIPANNMVHDSVIVQTSVRDAQAVSIDAPTGTQPTGAVIAPQATVRNNSSAAQTFQVRFTISDGYTDTRSVTLAPDSQQAVTFNNWTATLIGTWVTRCTTMLTGDANPANDMVHDSVIVQATVPDVQVFSIDAPVGTVDQGTVVLPKATVRNNGTTSLNFDVRYMIAPGYTDQKNVTLLPHMLQQVTFAAWTASPQGWLASKCTVLVADPNPVNNRMTDSVFVRFLDAGADAIVQPGWMIVDSGALVTPQAMVHNRGNANATFDAVFSIGASYTDQQTVTSLAPGDTKTVSFIPWTATERGTQATKCTTRLTGDMNPVNDRARDSVDVRVRDVAASAILAPLDTVDSGTVMVPRATIRNYGSHTETFAARFTIGTAYTSTKTVTALAPGTSLDIDFDSWTASELGALVTQCTTLLLGDQLPGNDAMNGSVVVRHVAGGDVGVLSILKPLGAYDSLQSDTPRAVVHNFGSSPATFPVRMAIAPAYTSTKTVTALAPGGDRTVDFDLWPARARGTWSVRCSTMLGGDADPSNDVAQDSVTVNVHDIAAVSIVAPRNSIPIESIIPQARIHNGGTLRDSLTVTFEILEDSFVSLLELPDGIPVGHDTIVDFDIYYAGIPGSYTTMCSTWSRKDQFAPNNIVGGRFSVAMNDVGVEQVLAPLGSFDTSVVLNPSAKFHNWGIQPSTFHAYCLLLTDSDATVYTDSITVANLQIGADTTLTFAAWSKPHAEGSYAVRCSTWLSGDANTSNDTLAGAFTITSTLPEAHWLSMLAMPTKLKVKNVKDGGALAYGKEATDANDTGYVYAFKGNNTYEFYRFNTSSNAWISRDSIPAVGSSGKKKGVKKGSALIVGTDSKVYGAKGNNNYEFWCYDPEKPDAQHWAQLTDVPMGAKALKEGTGLAAVNISGTDYVYLLKGAGTAEFYRYKVSDGSWETMDDAPLGASGKPYKNGSSIIYDGNDTIWCLKGSYNEFAAYSVAGKNWVTKDTLPRKAPPSTKKTKVKDGSQIAYSSRVVYALKGGNTNEFWKYLCNDQKWYTAEPMPVGPKKVKGGGALCVASSAHSLFALRGNNTLELWQYGPVAFDFLPLTSFHGPTEVQEQSASGISQFALNIAPNLFTSSLSPSISYSLPRAGSITLGLYDVTGRLVNILASGYRPAGVSSLGLGVSTLPRGVYVLRLHSDSQGMTLSRKLVIE